jgi:hypothetical protein
LALACAALALAACGSSANKSTRTAHAKAFVAFSECMRAHGVTNFPDPSSSGGIQITPSMGISPFSPSFKGAQAKCSHLLPNGGPGHVKPTRQQVARAVAMSQCMRDHGVTGFPDPATKMPANRQDYGELENRGGIIIAIPKSIDAQSPAFTQAGRACGFH